MLIVILYSLAATCLAIYGLHVLLLVIQYGRHRNDQPRTHRSGATIPIVTVQLPLYNEPSCRRTHHRRGGQPRLAARSLADSSAGRFHRSHDGAGPIARGGSSGARPRHRTDPSRASHRLQGGRAGERSDVDARANSSPSSTRTSCPRPTSCAGCCRISSPTRSGLRRPAGIICRPRRP